MRRRPQRQIATATAIPGGYLGQQIATTTPPWRRATWTVDRDGASHPWRRATVAADLGAAGGAIERTLRWVPLFRVHRP